MNSQVIIGGKTSDELYPGKAFYCSVTVRIIKKMQGNSNRTISLSSDLHTGFGGGNHMYFLDN